MSTTAHHRVVIVGGGNAGISVAARLRRSGVEDVAVIEPASTHYYQPLWTLVGGGCAPVRESMRSQASVMPTGVRWVRDRAEGVDPENRGDGLGRPAAGAAHADHAAIARELDRSDLAEGDVHCPGSVTGSPLVVLADVRQQRPVVQQGPGPGRR